MKQLHEQGGEVRALHPCKDRRRLKSSRKGPGLGFHGPSPTRGHRLTGRGTAHTNGCFVPLLGARSLTTGTGRLPEVKNGWFGEAKPEKSSLSVG
jgi:hypothetical protein